MKTTLLYIITTLVALSGWVTYFHNIITNRPKIVGKVLQIMTSEWQNPKFQKPKTAIFIYMYLVNKRKNPVHILDYEVEIDLGNGFERLQRVYGTKNLAQPTFESEEYLISMPNLNENLINSKNIYSEYGVPIHGFALFASDRSHIDIKGKIKKIKVTCLDAFNNRHIVKGSPSDFVNLIYLQDISGIEIKKKNISDHDSS